jgi:hypothetical protein
MVPRFCRSFLFESMWLAALGLAAASACGEKPAPNDLEEDGDTDTTAALPLAAGVTMTEIELYQAVRIPVMADGEAVGDTGVTVVAGKDAFVRVYAEYASDFEPRELYLRVELSDGSSSEVASALLDVTEEMVATPSSLGDIASTLNITVPGEIIQAGRTISFSLHEESEDAEGGDTAGAAWPAEGGCDLAIDDENAPMKLVLVPVEYNADGSGRLPDTSDEQILKYLELFEGMYPVSGVEITIDEPMPYSGAINPLSGDSWANLLNAVGQRRFDNGAPDEEFYYGLVRPAESFGEYCGGGCITGMSNLASGPGAMQTGSGIGFPGAESTYTAAHEVGHAAGREHSPGCGAMGVDPDYPYSGGFIGVTGYDPSSGLADYQRLKDSSTTYDIMSYCTPQWISDFTYMGIYQRFEQIGQSASLSVPPDAPRTWLSIDVRLDGTARRGPMLDSALPFEGEARQVALLDAAGALLEEVDGVFLPRADFGGGLVAFREPGPGAVAARVSGFPAVELR